MNFPCKLVYYLSYLLNEFTLKISYVKFGNRGFSRLKIELYVSIVLMAIGGGVSLHGLGSPSPITIALRFCRLK